MTTMTDNAALNLLAQLMTADNQHTHHEAFSHIAARLREPAGVGAVRYDAGLLSDFGGGNVEWWQDYIRAELERAHDFYTEALEAAPQPPAEARECKCNMRTKLVGDGCDVCNPEYAAQFADDPAESQANKWEALIGKWQARAEAAGYEGVEGALEAAEAQAQVGGEACPHCKGNPGLDCNSFGRTAPPSAPVASEHVRRLVGKLDHWRKCMSHNESYFGEPSGLVKATVTELARAVDPIYPPKPEHKDPLAGVVIRTATVPLSKAPSAPVGVDAMDRAMDAYRAACAEWRKNPDNRDEPEAMHGVRAVVEALAQQAAAVDGVMVERAMTAYLQSRGTYEGEVPVDRDDMRAAQPGGSDNDQ